MEKTIEYWKKNAEEDYETTPISVLKYIGELEYLISKLPPLLPSSTDEEYTLVEEARKYWENGRGIDAVRHIRIAFKNMSLKEGLNYCLENFNNNNK